MSFSDSNQSFIQSIDPYMHASIRFIRPPVHPSIHPSIHPSKCYQNYLNLSGDPALDYIGTGGAQYLSEHSIVFSDKVNIGKNNTLSAGAQDEVTLELMRQTWLDLILVSLV